MRTHAHAPVRLQHARAHAYSASRACRSARNYTPVASHRGNTATVASLTGQVPAKCREVRLARARARSKRSQA